LPDDLRHLPHLLVSDRARFVDLTRPGYGNPKIRPVERRVEGRALLRQARGAFTDGELGRDESSISEEELRALGTFVTIEGGDRAYPLSLDELERWSRHRKSPKLPQWLLMSVRPATASEPERAIVWVSDQYRANFLKLFEEYLEKTTRLGNADNWESPEGNPAHRALVANIATIRTTILRDLWQSGGEPPDRGSRWWELWIARTADPENVLADLARLGIHAANRVTILHDRLVVWVDAAWSDLQVLPFSRIPLAEIRWPSFIETIEDLSPIEQSEWVDDLIGRLTPADGQAPTVCHLDTGVARTHVLLAGSLDEADLHTVVGTTGFDAAGHGTKMAGIALYGDLDAALTANAEYKLRHRLESVRILPSATRNEPVHDPLDYGTVTSEAVSTVEVAAPRRRAFCMPVSADPDNPGEPTLWSSTVDALCAGTDVAREGSQLRLLGLPDFDATRLFFVAAGNTELPDTATALNPLDLSDTTGIVDPGQAWNVITVGAYTDRVDTPSAPEFAGWRPMADRGELSPHSRTSVPFGLRKWPIKPDICMEGGNVLTDGTQLDTGHPLLSVRTTGIGNDRVITSANATSAATASAARLAAIAMVEYPDYWPETIRGLLIHGAQWTPRMQERVRDRTLHGSLTKRLALLRRYGWGVPTEATVLHSSTRAVTMVIQDEFVPFDGDDFAMRHFRLHHLPWPAATLLGLGASTVSLRVTCSYYVEPNPSRRGWRQRYAYASHGLRFDLKAPLETDAAFVARINGSATSEEGGASSPSSGTNRWLIGPNQRNYGSLHQDIWEGSGADLARCDRIAVYPVGGWWKNNRSRDRLNLPVRYALIVSLTTDEQGVDLYTPIQHQLRVPTAVAVPAT
jgi:hypothetical protein